MSSGMFNLSFIREKIYRIKIDIEPLRFLWLPLAIVFWVFPRRGIDERQKRILVINFGGLGDILMMTSALRALKNRFPTCTIDLMVGKGTPIEEAFTGHPDINQIIPIIRARMFFLTSSPSMPILAVIKILYLFPSELVYCFKKKYSFSLNYGTMFQNLEHFGNAFTYTLRIPTRIGYSGDENHLLTNSIKRNKNYNAKQLYLSCLEPLGIKSDNQEMYFPVKKSVNPILNDVLIQKKKGLLVVIHPGGKVHINSRRWPLEYFVEVAHYLLSLDVSICLTGGVEDSEVCNELTRKLNKNIYNLCNKLSFKDTAFLLSCSDACLTNDTSIVHLADAVQVKHILAIFGPTDPSHLINANSRYIIFRPDSSVTCAPCRESVAHEDIMPCSQSVKYECLKSIPPQKIINALKKVLINSNDSKRSVKTISSPLRD